MQAFGWVKADGGAISSSSTQSLHDGVTDQVTRRYVDNDGVVITTPGPRPLHAFIDRLRDARPPPVP